MKKHLLFICTANVCRSKTAASLFEKSDIYEAKSAGVHLENGFPESKLVTQEMINWADEIIVMSEQEDHHMSFLREHFSLQNKKTLILGIPNIYDTFIPAQKSALVEMLKDKLSTYLPQKQNIKYKDFLQTCTKCPFCEPKERIIVGSEYSFLTYCRAPYHAHHLLVIPYRHVESISELQTEELLDIFTLQKTAITLLKRLGYASASLLIREGNALNKSIPHVHFHVIPQIRIGDLDHYGRERTVMTDLEIHNTLEDIKNALRD